MRNHGLRYTCALSALVAGLAGAAPAIAQTAPQEEPSATAAPENPVIVVTGSLIRGTPEDAALPVDVISQEELVDRGSPTALDLIKSLPGSSGVLGDSNQFDSRSQGSEGVATVNLRGRKGVICSRRSPGSARCRTSPTSTRARASTTSAL